MPRRRAGAQTSVSCNGCAGLWPALPFSLVKITRRRRQIIPGPKSVYPSRFARGAVCGPSFTCEPVAMIQTSNHLMESSKFRRNGSYSLAFLSYPFFLSTAAARFSRNRPSMSLISHLPANRAVPCAQHNLIRLVHSLMLVLNYPFGNSHYTAQIDGTAKRLTRPGEQNQPLSDYYSRDPVHDISLVQSNSHATCLDRLRGPHGPLPVLEALN